MKLPPPRPLPAESNPRRFGLSAILAVLLAGVAGAQDYEALPVLRSADLLEAAWLESGLHRVDPGARIEEGLGVFVLRSVYGVEEVHGTDFLRKRVREIHAAAALSEKGVGGAAVKGLIDETAGTVKNLGSAVRRPVRTVLNIPKGIGSMVKGAAESTKNQVQDKGNYSGGAVRDWFDVSEPKLKLASELGVDPYSDFGPLQDQLQRLAGTSMVSGLGIRLIVPGDGIIGAAAKGEAARQLNDVFLTPPSQLLKENSGLLEGAGVTKEAAANFFGSRSWSPAEQALLVREIASFGRPSGAEALLGAAAAAPDRPSAFHFLRSAGLLRLQHRRSPVTGLASFYGFPVAISAEGRLVLPLALDRVYWTENAAGLAAALVAEARAAECSGADLLLSGGLSERAAEALAAAGIRVIPANRN